MEFIVPLNGIILDKLETLRIFAAIADAGGFSSAARRLRVSPQAATRAVAQLEAELGVQLLQRTTRSVRLTDDGATFLVRTRRVLADLRDAEQAVMGARTEPRGTLVVTAPVAFGRIHVVPILAALLKRHVQLSVRLVLADRMLQLVEEGIDVAVRIGELPDSALRAIRVGEVRQVLAASPAYLQEHAIPDSPADLRQHALIMFAATNAADEWRFGPGGKRSVRVRPRMLVNTAEAAIAAAEAGVGITRVLSYQVSTAIAAGRLRTVLESDSKVVSPVNLLFHDGRRDSANVRSFIEEAKEYFRSAVL